MKEMKINTDLTSQSGWSKYFAPIAAVVIVILTGVLTYALSVASQVPSSLP